MLLRMNSKQSWHYHFGTPANYVKTLCGRDFNHAMCEKAVSEFELGPAAICSQCSRKLPAGYQPHTDRPQKV